MEFQKQMACDLRVCLPVFSENNLFRLVFEVICVWTLFRFCIQIVSQFYPNNSCREPFLINANSFIYIFSFSCNPLSFLKHLYANKLLLAL